jgi:proteasome lid subunit RPN8/RPN11
VFLNQGHTRGHRPRLQLLGGWEEFVMSKDFRSRIKVLSGSEDASPLESVDPSGERTQNVSRLPQNAVLTAFHCEGEDESDRVCRVIFPQSAYEQVTQHLSTDTTREHGGFLLGYEIASGESQPATVVIERAVPAKYTQGTPVRLTFTTDTWREFDLLTENLRQCGFPLQRVGWYHSHPDIAIFLSRWDLDVCKTFDRRRYPIALVVDPVGNRGGFFVRKKTGYEPHRPQGFEELHDLTTTSMVAWTNMSPSLQPSRPEGQTVTQNPPSPPAPVLPVETRQPEAPAKNEAKTSTTQTTPQVLPSRRESQSILTTIAALVLSGIVVGLGLLYLNQRNLANRIDQLAAEQRAVAKRFPAANSSSEQPQQTSRPVVSVGIDPKTAELGAGQRQEFKATVSGAGNNQISWSATPAVGLISGDGIYTAPSTLSSRQQVSVRAASVADATTYAEAVVTLVPSAPADISITIEPQQITLMAGGKEKFVAHVKGGSGAVTWSLQGSGSLGAVSGTGEYTAPSEVTQPQVVKLVATSTADKNKSAEAIIMLQPVENPSRTQDK